MKIGVVFPQTEIGEDPSAIAHFVKTAEELGYNHLLVYDHVLGAVPTGPGWLGYTHEDMFHEVFVLLGYVAAVTRRLELVTSILVLPQRQTVLAAKQAAEVDVLSNGRLRLGIGVGWNEVEYEGLGKDFKTRGTRIEEQVHLLRALWTERVVTFDGRWHKMKQVGINPLPAQRPIPLWMGGESDAALRRAARLADGWIAGGTLRTPFSRHPGVTVSQLQSPAASSTYRERVGRLREYLRRADRSPTTFGLERRVAYASGPEAWVRAAVEWSDLGGTHLGVNTMQADLESVAGHVKALRHFYTTVTSVIPAS